MANCPANLMSSSLLCDGNKLLRAFKNQRVELEVMRAHNMGVEGAQFAFLERSERLSPLGSARAARRCSPASSKRKN